MRSSKNILLRVLLIYPASLVIFLIFNSCEPISSTNTKSKESTIHKQPVISLDSATLHEVGKQIDLKQNHLVWFYPNFVCDVCDVDIFEQIKNNESRKALKSLVVLIPYDSYRDFLLYNEEYSLEIRYIIPYKGAVFDKQETLARSSFFVLQNRTGKSLYTPAKPIEAGRFSSYLDHISDQF